MQNLFLQCKLISIYKPSSPHDTLYQPGAGGNHVVLGAYERFMPREQWKPVVPMR